MKSNEFFDRLKMIEITRLLVSQYNYREMEVRNIEGIFLENKLAKYSIIHISNNTFTDVEQFEEYNAKLQKVKAEFDRISNLSDSKMLSFYFDGEVKAEDNDIYSIVIKNNEDIRTNEMINNDFPALGRFVNIDQFTGSFSNLNEPQTTSSERRVVDLFSYNQQMKKIRFTRFFIYAFMLVNILAILFIENENIFKYDLAFYEPFFIHFNQYYRLITGLFVNTSLFAIFVFAYFFIKNNTYVELKLGTKKTMLIYGLGVFCILIAMIFQSNGSVILGSFPLAALFIGVYIGVSSLPSEGALLMNNVIKIAMLLVVTVVIFLPQGLSIPIGFVALLSGIILVNAFNQTKIDLKYLISFLFIIVFMVGASILPNQTLKQAFSYEQDYLKYSTTINQEKAKQYQKSLADYYKKIGAVDYNE